MKYFANVNSFDELKKQYRRLAMQYHPDRGGDTETMKAINAEHDEIFEQLKHAGTRRTTRNTRRLKARRSSATPSKSF